MSGLLEWFTHTVCCHNFENLCQYLSSSCRHYRHGKLLSFSFSLSQKLICIPCSHIVALYGLLCLVWTHHRISGRGRIRSIFISHNPLSSLKLPHHNPLLQHRGRGCGGAKLLGQLCLAAVCCLAAQSEQI